MRSVINVIKSFPIRKRGVFPLMIIYKILYIIMGDFPHSEMLNDIRDIMTFDIRDPPRKKSIIFGKHS